LSRVIELVDAEIRIGGHLVVSAGNLAGFAGQIVAVRGTNGAGKTSVLKALVGVVELSGGSRQGPPSSAYVPAAVEPPPPTARRWARLFPRAHRAGIERALEVLQFQGELDGPCRALSFGNLRKLLLAEALSSNERLIAIDEMNAGLDEQGVAGLVQLARAAADEGSCVVMSGQSSHVSSVADETYFVQNRALVKMESGSAADEICLMGPADKIAAIRQYSQTLGVVETVS